MKNFSKKIVSIILVAMLLFSVIPLSASAAVRIGSVSVIDVSVPVEGQECDYGVYIPASTYTIAEINSNGYENGIIWYDEDGNYLEPGIDKYRAGVSYTVKIQLVPTDSNIFMVMNAEIDGESVKYSATQNLVTLEKTFPAVEDKEDVLMLTFDYGFDGLVEYIFCEYGEIPDTPDYIDNGELILFDWYADEYFTEPFDMNAPVTEDATVYARYIHPSDLVTIYMYTDDPEFPYSIADGVIGDYVNVPDPRYEDTFMFFTGWYADKELTQEYDFSQPIEGDVHLYARLISYDDVAIITTYMPNESFYTDYYEVEKGEYIYIPDPDVEEDMYFDGWFYDAKYTRPYDSSLPVTEDFALYAKFIPFSEMHIVSIWLYPTDEFPVGSGYAKDGQLYDIEPPAQEGMIFDGWYTEPELINKIEVPFTVTSDVDLYAKFVPEVEKHEVAVYVFSDTEPVVIVEIDDGTYYTPAEPGIEGKVFMGWYTDVERTVEYDYAPVTEDLKLYAKFVALEDLCKVALYVFSDTEPVISIGIEKGTYYTPAEPGMEGKVFEGWYTEAERINKVDTPFLVTEDVNLYAKFVPENDFVLGDVNGDGEVSIIDATLVQRHVAKIIELSDDAKLRADANKDGDISVVDATFIQRHVAKIIELS